MSDLWTLKKLKSFGKILKNLIIKTVKQMNYTTKGTVHAIMRDKVKSETFTKDEFILAVADGEYTEYVKFQLINDRRGQLSNVTEGDQVTVNFNIKGREHVKNGEKQYYTNLDAWKIEH